MDPLDVVYVVRIGDDNEELRYSLRSLHANLPHARVWIAGYAPKWVNRARVHVIETEWQRCRFRSSTDNLRAFLEHPHAPLNAVLMNDDFFIMEPIPSVPPLNRGPAHTVLETSGVSGDYAAGLRRTVAILRTLGHDAPLSYELHAPMVVNVPHMREILKRYGEVQGLHKRTLYGNVTHLAGRTVVDVKVKNSKDGFSTVFDPRAPFVSTNDHSFRHGAVGAFIRERFSEPSPYELREADYEECNLSEVTYENTVTGRIVVREPNRTMDLSRRWRRVDTRPFVLEPVEAPESPSEDLEDEADVSVPKPDGRSSLAAWEAYAAHCGIELAEGMTKAEIRAYLEHVAEEVEG
jgi:hypothetical protein